jgi:hypothetical protein
MPYVCNQCVHRNIAPEKVTFDSLESAEEHLASVHSARFMVAYRNGVAYSERVDQAHDWLNYVRTE